METGAHKEWGGWPIIHVSIVLGTSLVARKEARFADFAAPNHAMMIARQHKPMHTPMYYNTVSGFHPGSALKDSTVSLYTSYACFSQSKFKTQSNLGSFTLSGFFLT